LHVCPSSRSWKSIVLNLLGSCSDGEYLSGSTCTSAPAGYYRPIDASSDNYYICDEGTYSTGGATACTSCGAGTSGFGASSCLYPTSHPTSVPTSHPIGSCLVGTYYSVGTGTCQLAPVGELYFIIKSDVVLCNSVQLLGTFVSSTHASAATTCSTSFFEGSANCQIDIGRFLCVAFASSVDAGLH
jgi:hypothetical protein